MMNTQYVESQYIVKRNGVTYFVAIPYSAKVVFFLFYTEGVVIGHFVISHYLQNDQ